MPALQTTFNEVMRPALAGMIADMTPQEIVSRVVEPAAGLGFGVAAFQGTGDKQIRAAAVGRVFVGVVILDPTIVHMTQPAGSPDFVPQYRLASVMRRGTIWVVAGAAIAAGDPVAFVPATGAFVPVATAGSTPIPGAIFDTSAANTALVKLRMS